MGDDQSEISHRSRRRREDDDEHVHDESSSRKRRHHERDRDDKRRHRPNSRSGSRDRRKRARSEADDRLDRPRSRERRKDDDRDRERRRSGDREARRDRHRHRSKSPGNDRRRDRDNSRSRRHRRHRTSESPDRLDYPSSRKQEDTQRQRRHRSPSTEKATFSKSRAVVRQAGPLPDQEASFAVSAGLEPEKPKEQPSFKPSGALAAAANAVTTGAGETVTLKYHEPPEARKPPPKDRWKLFVFKGDAVVDTIELSHRSCWLIGRETAVVDLPVEHPSISKQHAVVQFRYTEKRNEYGDRIGRVKPYLIDLESANGTMLNGEKVPDSRYLELRDKDVVKFGQSTREYVLMLDRD